MGLINQLTKMARKTEGSNPGGGLVVEKLFLGRNDFPRVEGQEVFFRGKKESFKGSAIELLGRRFLPLPTSLTKSLGALLEVNVEESCIKHVRRVLLRLCRNEK